MTEDMNDLLNVKYSLIRLVYINSANHAYSEIMLDSHMAMFGNNNVGKTASLAGTKLLLFPEVNFYKCESKFGFKGKSGLYTTEESYEFYFPDALSFIVLEVENPEGRFCMVLYRASNFGYGRFFIPVEYEKLRHLFWDKNTEYFADDMSFALISKFSKANEGLQVTDRKEIADLIFSGYRGTKAKQRFCMLPLKDEKSESITAFCNIYQLAFETGELGEKTLPNAIATLLEMGRSRDQERLDANLIRLSDEHSDLHKKGNLLQKITNSKPLFAKNKDDYDNAKRAIDSYSIAFLSLNKVLDIAKANYAIYYSALNGPYSEKSKELLSLNADLSTLSKQIVKQTGVIEATDSSLGKKRIDLGRAKEKKASYTSMSIAEIIQILEEDIKEDQAKLKGYQTEGGIKKILADNISRSNRLGDEIDDLNKLVEGNEPSVLFQLEDNMAASILYSINRSFSNVTAELTDSDKRVLLCFTQLFTQDDTGQITLLGQRLANTSFTHYEASKQRDQNIELKAKKKREKSDLDVEIREQHQALKYENVDALIAAAIKEINCLNKDLADISGIATLENDVKELEIELEGSIETNKLDEARQQVLSDRQLNVEGEYIQLEQKLNDLKRRQEAFESLDYGLKVANQNMRPVNLDAEPAPVDKLTQDYVREIIKMSTDCTGIYKTFRDSFQILSIELPHDDIDIHQQRFWLSDYEQAIQVYNSAFQTLEYDMQQYQNAVRSHNQLVNNQLNELKEARSLLGRFILEINSELNKKVVSNLSAIRLHVELNPSFLSLLSTLDEHDIQDDSLLDPIFYESLSKFAERYFDKGSRRLKMNDIISSINYHYTLRDTGEEVTRSQSGGTTSAITAFVLAVLFKRVTPPYVLLKMPIIVDEIGALDSSNTDSTIQQITDHGFSIFCATPTFSALVSQKVGRWIMIDKWVIKQPIVPKCHINVMPEHVDSFGDKAV